MTRLQTGRKFGAVEVTFWHDPKVRGWTFAEQLAALYLLTCPASTPEGFYHLSLAAAADDLGMSRDDLQDTWTGLTEQGFMEYDEQARVVFVCKALKYHSRISGERALKAALKDLNHAQGAPRLFARFLQAADRYQPVFAAEIRRLYGLSEPAGSLQTPCTQDDCSELSQDSEQTSPNKTILPINTLDCAERILIERKAREADNVPF